MKVLYSKLFVVVAVELELLANVLSLYSLNHCLYFVIVVDILFIHHSLTPIDL